MLLLKLQFVMIKSRVEFRVKELPELAWLEEKLLSNKVILE